MIKTPQIHTASQVDVIPATKRHMENGDQFRSQTSLRVAAYCRVSTEEESQEGSYAAQKSHYTALILGKPGWEMAGIYADEGKSGTSRKKRGQFNQMMEDAREGKIDYIITKSISRFARNTADALDCVHELQRLRPPVGIYFERENIDTLNAGSEMFLTFYCSMAQEESRSISENIKWSIQKNFRSGRPQINLRRMLGYDQCKDGSWKINEEQAETVHYIYEHFLQGVSANAIARELNDSGRGTVCGGTWRADTVFNVLRNEKYAGDLMMQKTYTESFLTHKSVPNRGEYPQYFLKNHHPAIIDRTVWNQVQELLLEKQLRGRRMSKKVETSVGEIEIGLELSVREKQEKTGKNGRKPGPSASHFHGLVCACCGGTMRRMTYNSVIRNYRDERSHAGKSILPGEEDFTDVYSFSYAVWKCPNSAGKTGRDQAGRKCMAITLTEISMEQSFMEMLYRIKGDFQLNGNDSEIMKNFQIAYNAICQKERNSEFIEQKLKLLEMQIEELESSYRKALWQKESVSYAAGITLGQGGERDCGEESMEASGIAYARLADDLKKHLEQRKAEHQQLLGERGVAQTMKKNFDAFLTAVNELPDQNAAGMQMNINEQHVAGSIFPVSGNQSSGCAQSQYHQDRLCMTPEMVAAAPDYLRFSPYIMRTFILKMEAREDEIHYGTTFGLTLIAEGNSRSIKSYVGYRKGKEDGTVDMILESHQISKGKIQHRWQERKKR